MRLESVLFPILFNILKNATGRYHQLDENKVLISVMVGRDDLGRKEEEMLPKEWSDKREHSPQLYNGQNKKLRKEPLLSYQVVKVMWGGGGRVKLYFQICKILLL